MVVLVVLDAYFFFKSILGRSDSASAVVTVELNRVSSAGGCLT
jgi:hypothetical protein